MLGADSNNLQVLTGGNMFKKEKLKLAGAVALIAFITQFLEVLGLPQFAQAIVEFIKPILGLP